MVNLFRVVEYMIGSLDLYRDAVEKDIKVHNYFAVCKDSRRLLKSFGEEKINEWELIGNSEKFKRGLHALKTLSDQLDEDVIDEDLVRCAYNKFKENSGVFMGNLFEMYIREEDIKREDKCQ